MKRRTRQRGLTAIGWIFLLIIFGFFTVIGLKLIPIYIESFKIDAAIEGVISDPEVSRQSKRDIILAVTRRLDIDEVDLFDERNYKDYMTVKKQQDKVSITVRYRAERELLGNLSVVADFDKHVEN